MRKIKFKGKSLMDGQWYSGDLPILLMANQTSWDLLKKKAKWGSLGCIK